MNIVHITCFGNNKASGIANIVPEHIKAQSKHVNILWYNLNDVYTPENKKGFAYFNLVNIPQRSIKFLPFPFSTPDLVVFHGVYFPVYCKIARELKEKNIPYIVVPHGSLTTYTIKQKFLKKRIGFLFLFNKYLKNAKAIQYLTKGEQIASGDKWNTHSLIIPNGCTIPLMYKNEYNKQNLKGVFIGRKSIFNKGLDLLIEACNQAKDTLKSGNLEIHIYGPDEKDSSQLLNKHIQKYGLEEIIFIHESVFGEKKVEILKESDFFILTSRSEGHPVAVIEALSYAVPCLVTRETNMGEEIQNANAGWMVDANSKDIAKALYKIINIKKEIPTIGDNARRLSLNYEWDNIAKLAINEYRNILE